MRLAVAIHDRQRLREHQHHRRHQRRPASSGQILRGSVYDSAFRSLAGVKVEVVDGPSAGVSTMSNPDGSFSLAGTFDDTVAFRASREGYVTATRTQQRNPTGSVWLSFTLSVLAAPVAIAGDYTLTLSAASACAGSLPEGARERTYAATISPSLYPGAPPRLSSALRSREPHSFLDTPASTSGLRATTSQSSSVTMAHSSSNSSPRTRIWRLTGGPLFPWGHPLCLRSQPLSKARLSTAN